MPANTKEVKLRLNSIKNTRKITKAMELVAAAKTRKAVGAALESRLYHRLVWNLVKKILTTEKQFREDNPTRRFFAPLDNPRHRTIVVFTSNRGLCGSFNSNIIRMVIDYVSQFEAGTTSIVSVGNKGTAEFASLRLPVEFAIKKNDSARDDSSIISLADYIYNKFVHGQTDQVLTAYTDFAGMLKQTPRLRQIFPFADVELGATEKETVALAREESRVGAREYLFEPNRFEVLSFLVPRIGAVELYQDLLESNASEHSARMLAMKNASDAAAEMGDELTLEFNKARQAAITREIAEISAGAAAIA